MTKAVFDLMRNVERIGDAFHAAVFANADVAAATALLGADIAVLNLPVGTGATGVGPVGTYLADRVLPHLPDDLTFHRVSRTGDRWRVAQENTVTFTHDRELPWLLPGVSPTGRRAEVLAVSVVRVQHGRITSHRTLWDQLTLLDQLGLARSDVRSGI